MNAPRLDAATIFPNGVTRLQRGRRKVAPSIT
jgi:hypothetical protein